MSHLACALVCTWLCFLHCLPCSNLQSSVLAMRYGQARQCATEQQRSLGGQNF